MLTNKYLNDFIQQSNAIEGIDFYNHGDQRHVYNDFLARSLITIEALTDFATQIEPGVQLRDKIGLNVTVGNHTPLPGGVTLMSVFHELLDDVREKIVMPWRAHCRFLTLHPFTDCNGRTARVLWLWMMNIDGYEPLNGFLQEWYYQTLEYCDKS